MRFVVLKALALKLLDDSIDFDTIPNLAAKVNFTFTSADAQLRAKRDEKKAFKNAVNSNRNEPGHYRNKRDMHKPNLPNSIQKNSPSQEQVFRALKEGLCRTCFKKSHKSNDCVENKNRGQYEKFRNERINNLYQNIFPGVESAVDLESVNAALDEFKRDKLTEENFICEANDQDFLNKRLGGKSWTITCTIACNGFSLTTSNALPDTDAGGYIFINRDIAKKALKYLNPQRVIDFPPSPVAGFDGKATQLIDFALILNLKIDGREIVNVTFLVINMKHDLILGRKWFEDYGVVIDCR
ncbi:hypothetical protein GcM3_140017 [Golovinomyces cichoracearum]|uniref:Uncharacterized protein n=1 Tax=Golovinomyces cichoracearum TaxID=62708 RepID=A0A420I0M6_9PEZI|nr:hypothetical protein GcM3_140017 [Golovinomyces cichoracearum]